MATDDTPAIMRLFFARVYDPFSSTSFISLGAANLCMALSTDNLLFDICNAYKL